VTVFVDELRAHVVRDDADAQTKRHFGGGKLSCHLTASGLDCAALAELHVLARRIGLRRAWFQNGSWPHYDLTAKRRVAAVEAGAVEETNRAGALRRAKVRAAYAEIRRAAATLLGEADDG
jgi:pyruvate/2-oxoglutarate dehydrogenase complex dihydrolipoamide acyltransferase (E2) component